MTVVRPSLDPTSPRATPLDEDSYALSRMRRRKRIYRLMAFVATYGAIIWLVSPWFFWAPLRQKVDDVLSQPLRAVVPLEVVNVDKTREKRDEAYRTSPLIVKYDSQVLQTANQNLTKLISSAREIARDYQTSQQTQVPMTLTRAAERLRLRLENMGLGGLNDDVLISLLTGLAQNNNFVASIQSLLTEIYITHGLAERLNQLLAAQERGELLIENEDQPPLGIPIQRDYTINLDDYDRLYKVIASSRAGLRYMPSGGKMRKARNEITSLLAQAPNIYIDHTRTSQHRQEVVQSVEPVVDRYDVGTVLIPAQTPLTREHLEILSAVNDQTERHLAREALAGAVFIALAYGFILLYLRRFHSDLRMTASTIWLVFLPILSALALGRLALILIPDPNLEVAGYLFPAGMVGILGLMLVDARLAIVMVGASALIFGIAVEYNLAFVATAIAGGVTGMVGLYHMRERKQFLMTGTLITLVNILCAALFSYVIRPDGQWPRTASELAPLTAALANGLLCIPLVYYMPIFYERFFGVITDIHLLELTARHPLLLRMEREAPGTYQHSLNVAKLAEAAADAIGANFLLTRAGAYFHDIGKIMKREYFTENQVTPDETNIHEKLKPSMSTLLIKNHIKEGVEMALKAGLPPRVVEFIPQHHGTMLISYFYNTAMRQYENSETKEPVEEDEFRYPGPKPQTRETAILMMADSVEATAQSKFSSRVVDADDIRLLVRDSVRMRFNDGQFDECPLTLRDLHLINESFVQTLKARYHRRVAYKK